MFEYDPEKSAFNKSKHGVDFKEAQELWIDADFIEIQAKQLNEPRFMVIGRIKQKIWSAIVMYRAGKIRIISVRRARKEEERLYESERFR